MAFTKNTKKIPAPAKVQPQDVEAAVTKSSSMTQSTLVNRAAKFRLDLQGEIDNLTNTLSEQLGELDTVNLAITAQQDRLKSLYDIEAAANSLDVLHTQIESDRKTHDEEVAEWEKTMAQRDADVREQRQREKLDLDYECKKRGEEIDMLMKQKRTQAEFDELLRASRVDEDIRKRQDVITAKEQHVVELEKAVAGHPSAIHSAVTAAVAAREKELHASHNSTTAELRGKIETITSVTTVKEGALLAQIDNLTKQLVNAQGAVDAAHRRAEEAVKQALAAASNQRAFEALQQQQANTTSAPMPTRRS